MDSLGTTLRTRIAPVAFLAAMALLTVHTCQTEIARVELRFDLGAHAHRVDGFRVDVFRDGEDVSVAFLERPDLAVAPPGPLSLSAQLDRGRYRLVFHLDTRSGPRHFERVIETADNATITLDLERDLAPDTRRGRR